MSHRVKKVECCHAPSAIGPYSQAIVAGNYVFVSGQLPIDPKTNLIVSGGIKEKTAQVLTNIEMILRELKLSLEDIVKMEIFLLSMNDFNSVNEVYESKFTSDIKPARHVVGVSQLPKNSDIEMSCIAFVGM